MAKRDFLRRNWKLILNAVTFLALIILVILLWDQIKGTFRDLGRVDTWALFLLIPIQFLNYHAQTKMYQGMFAVVGNKLSYKFLFKTAVELNFVNHVFPSGGVTGLSYFGLRLRNSEGQEISGGKATLIQVMKLVLIFVSFEVLLIIGLLCLSVMGRVSNLTILVGATISTLLLVGTVLFAYIVGSRSRINNFFINVTKGLNRIIQVIRPKHPETININRAHGMFDDFHASYQEIKSSYRQLYRPFWWALAANTTEILSIYVVYIAFGEFVNIGAVILAYGVANFAGLVSVLPGGVGIYEALMTAVMATAGVPARLSLPVTVMYRVLNTIIQLPPGYYLYHKALREGNAPSPTAIEHEIEIKQRDEQ